MSSPTSTEAAAPRPLPREVALAISDYTTANLFFLCFDDCLARAVKRDVAGPLGVAEPKAPFEKVATTQKVRGAQVHRWVLSRGSVTPRSQSKFKLPALIVMMRP